MGTDVSCYGYMNINKTAGQFCKDPGRHIQGKNAQLNCKEQN